MLLVVRGDAIVSCIRDVADPGVVFGQCLTKRLKWVFGRLAWCRRLDGHGDRRQQVEKVAFAQLPGNRKELSAVLDESSSSYRVIL